jgi:hypothetical protein
MPVTFQGTVTLAKQWGGMSVAAPGSFNLTVDQNSLTLSALTKLEKPLSEHNNIAKSHNILFQINTFL